MDDAKMFPNFNLILATFFHIAIAIAIAIAIVIVIVIAIVIVIVIVIAIEMASLASYCKLLYLDITCMACDIIFSISSLNFVRCYTHKFLRFSSPKKAFGFITVILLLFRFLKINQEIQFQKYTKYKLIL